MDKQVGRLIAALRERKLLEKTIILFTSDHGIVSLLSSIIRIVSCWSLGEHGEWEKYSNFGVATRVPLIVRLPKSIRSRRRSIVSDLIELVDIYPTLAELAHLPVPKPCGINSTFEIDCIESTSFASLLIKKKNGHRRKSAIFGQYPRPSLLPQLNSDQPRYADIDVMGYSIRTRRYRYTEWIEFGDESSNKKKRRKVANWNRIYARELYSIDDDRDENENVVDDRRYSAVADRLAKRLRIGWQTNMNN